MGTRGPEDDERSIGKWPEGGNFNAGKRPTCSIVCRVVSMRYSSGTSTSAQLEVQQIAHKLGQRAHGCAKRTLAVSRALFSVLMTSSWCATSVICLGRLHSSGGDSSKACNRGSREARTSGQRRALLLDPRLRRLRDHGAARAARVLSSRGRSGRTRKPDR